MLLDFEKPIAELESKLSDMKQLSIESDVDVSSAIKKLEQNILSLKNETFKNLTRWYLEISNREAVQKGYDIPSIGASIPKI